MKEGRKLRERIFSELHEIALDEARKIHREKVEHAAVIDAAGNKYVMARRCYSYETDEILQRSPLTLI